MYPVAEIFGPTIQGEGIQLGRRTMFVRLAGCDFRCRWCDTVYALDGANSSPLSPGAIVDRLQEMAPYCKTVTLTGGNPCIHDLQPLIETLHAHAYEIHIETQGSVWQECLARANMINLSPKPPSSGMDAKPLALDEFVNKSAALQLKIVISSEEDYVYARNLHTLYPDTDMVLQVCSQPGIDSKDTLLEKCRRLVDRVMGDPGFSDQVRVLPQMHVLIWGHERGK